MLIVIKSKGANSDLRKKKSFTCSLGFVPVK